MNQRPLKSPADSDVVKTELIMSKHINAVGGVFGGTLLSWADVTAALSGTMFAEGPVVTASLDAMSFMHPIRLGWIVTIYGRVNESFQTSMEVGVKISSVNPVSQETFLNSRGYFTIVAFDEKARPTAVPKLKPVTEDDFRRQKEAQQRRSIRMKLRNLDL